MKNFAWSEISKPKLSDQKVSRQKASVPKKEGNSTWALGELEMYWQKYICQIQLLLSNDDVYNTNCVSLFKYGLEVLSNGDSSKSSSCSTQSSCVKPTSTVLSLPSGKQEKTNKPHLSSFLVCRVFVTIVTCWQDFGFPLTQHTNNSHKNNTFMFLSHTAAVVFPILPQNTLSTQPCPKVIKKYRG